MAIVTSVGAGAGVADPGLLARASLNTATVKSATLAEAVEAAARAGFPAVGLWRDRVQEVGAERAAAIVRAAGLEVSSLCRGGFLTAVDDVSSAAALADNRRAIEEAAAVGARELVMVVGGLPACEAPGTPATPGGDKNLAAARERVAERLAELVPAALGHGVRLGLEALHPIFAADRAVICTLDQALDLAAPHPVEAVGVVVDTYHVWWDPGLAAAVARAGTDGRLACYQVGDWTLPIAEDPLLSRGHVGDGYIDVPAITSQVAAAGFAGFVETEIFNAQIWAAPVDAVARTVAERFAQHVAPYL